MLTTLALLKSTDYYAAFHRSAFSEKPGVVLLAYGHSDFSMRDDWMLASFSSGEEESYYYPPDLKKHVLPTTGQKVTELRRERGYCLQLFHDLIMSNRFYKE